MKRAVRTPSLVLKASPYSESSQIATLLTRDMGRIRVLARGIRKRRPGEAGGLDLLTLGWSTIRRSRSSELHLLDEAAPFQQWWRLRQSARRIHAAYYLLELAARLGPDETPRPALFRLFAHAAACLDRAGPTRPLLDFFALRALALAGALPRVDACARCSTPAAAIRQPRFDSVAGGLICDGCRASRPPIRLTHGALAVASYLLRSGELPTRLGLWPEQAAELGKMLANITRHLFGRPMRTEDLLTLGTPHHDGCSLARDLALHDEPALAPATTATNRLAQVAKDQVRATT